MEVFGGGRVIASIFLVEVLFESRVIGSEEVLRQADPNVTLQENLRNAFSVTNCPIWMDGSTKVLWMAGFVH